MNDCRFSVTLDGCFVWFKDNPDAHRLTLGVVIVERTEWERGKKRAWVGRRGPWKSALTSSFFLWAIGVRRERRSSSFVDFTWKVYKVTDVEFAACCTKETNSTGLRFQNQALKKYISFEYILINTDVFWVLLLWNLCSINAFMLFINAFIQTKR